MVYKKNSLFGVGGRYLKLWTLLLVNSIFVNKKIICGPHIQSADLSLGPRIRSVDLIKWVCAFTYLNLDKFRILIKRGCFGLFYFLLWYLTKFWLSIIYIFSPPTRLLPKRRFIYFFTESFFVSSIWYDK